MSSKHLKNKKKKNGKFSVYLIIGGLLILASLALFLKPKPEVQQPGISLEDHLDNALAEKQPTFVFLHSLDCIPCQDMMEIVAQVHPEFEEQVVLIDVDIYNQQNKNILKREGLRAIPTLVFYDTSGQRYVHVGVLPADQLRGVFQTMIGD